MTEGEIWGDARTPFVDWVGTAQIDARKTNPTLRDLIDLDHDEWMIVGLDIGGSEYGHDLHVMAVRRDPALKGVGWVAVDIAANNGGEIPVTDFLVHDVDPYQVLRAMANIFDLRLRVPTFGQFPIRVVELADIPAQPD